MTQRSVRRVAAATCLLLLPLFAAPASAASTCRAYTAAQEGATRGYSLAKSAAQSWSDYESDYSGALEDCLSQIRDLSLTVNLSANIDALLQSLEKKVCSVVVSSANSYIPPSVTLDPWSEVTSSVNSLF